MGFGEYNFGSSEADHTEGYLWPPVLRFLLNEQKRASGNKTRLLDLGCGNGAFARKLATLGFDVVGIDPSESGIAQAKGVQSNVRFEVGSAYDDLLNIYGEFDYIVSLEVVEHLYSPKTYAQNFARILRPGGFAIVSTPYHGYLKNLVLAVSNKMDHHFHALWEHGHIKFWSVRTLTKLFENEGLKVEQFGFAGRSRYLAKSMFAVIRKPDSQ